MTCQEDLLERLDLAIDDFEFPLWECGEESAVVGAMRASGFTSRLGVALVFERIEYSLKEDVIQCLTFCIATFPIHISIQVGEAVHLNIKTFESTQLPIDFGQVEVRSRDHVFSLSFEKEELISQNYLAATEDQLTPECLLFKICDNTPKDCLFCEPDYLKESFEMDTDAKRLFCVDEWQHPSFDEIYGDAQLRAAGMPDVITMVEALCSNRASFELSEVPNTSWRVQCQSDEL